MPLPAKLRSACFVNDPGQVEGYSPPELGPLADEAEAEGIAERLNQPLGGVLGASFIVLGDDDSRHQLRFAAMPDGQGWGVWETGGGYERGAAQLPPPPDPGRRPSSPASARSSSAS